MKVGRFQLPGAEDDLWDQVVLALLRQRDVSESQARDHLWLLEELAFHSRFCGKRLTQSFVEDTARWLARERDFGNPRGEAQKWLADLECWEFLIRDGSGHSAVYEFPIQGLDEYFAARHLAARWAEADQRYRGWLPCRRGWWWRGRRMRCPNPRCRITLPPFRKLFVQSEHREMLLLMVGMLCDAHREQVFLKGIRADLKQSAFSFRLRALGRCRSSHPDLVQALRKKVLHAAAEPATIEALSELVRGRIQDHGDFILKYCVAMLRGQGRLFWGAHSILEEIGDAGVDQLVAGLSNDDETIRFFAEESLREMVEAGTLEVRDRSAVGQLLVAVKADDETLSDVAADALCRVRSPEGVDLLAHALKNEVDSSVRGVIARAFGASGASIGSEQAVIALVDALKNDPDDATRCDIAHALGLIGSDEAIAAVRNAQMNDSSAEVRAAAADAIEYATDGYTWCIKRGISPD